LAEEDRAGALQLDQHSHREQERQQDNQSDKRYGDIHRPLGAKFQ